MLRLRGRPVGIDACRLQRTGYGHFARIRDARTHAVVGHGNGRPLRRVVAKHLYGGLGYNLFNPAMVGYVVVLVAFPMDMNLWTAPRMGDLDYQFLTFAETARFTLTGHFRSHCRLMLSAGRRRWTS